MADWLNPLRWLLPRVSKGQAAWCGRYLIIHAPINWSLLMGRGTLGLELFRRVERKHG